jgi:ketosteroid isomerase-like protein
MVPGSLGDWIEGYRVAWEQRDADAAAALFTEDATYRSEIFSDPSQGREGVHGYWTSVTAAQSEVEVKMGRPFVEGKRVAVEFWTNMKGDGADVTLPGCMLLDFDDNWLCRRLREYYHYQPGHMDPPPEWGT